MFKRLWWLLLGIVVWCLVSTLHGASVLAIAQPEPPLPLIAQASLEDLQRQQQQLEQQRSKVSEERTRLKNLEKAAQKTLTGLQTGIKLTDGEIKAKEAQLQQETQKLRDLETKLVSTEQNYRQKRFSAIARLHYLQRQNRSNGLAVLLQSKSLNDFLDRQYRLKRIYQADQQTLISLKADTDRLNQQRDLVEQKKNEISLLNQQLLSQKATLEDQVLYQKVSIERLRSDHRAMEVAENQLEKDSESLRAMIMKRMGTGERTAFRGTGRMILPCVGEITSPFGWRMHPVLGYERFHAGLDIGADYGTTISAAEQGTVIFSGWYGGYGNAVILDHGGGITTLYAHASELYVVEGQTVQRGQAIAAVGSTGLSTGPHLHFEVHRDGEPTDPVAFL